MKTTTAINTVSATMAAAEKNPYVSIGYS